MDRFARPTTSLQAPNLGGLNMELMAGRKKVMLAPGHSLMDWINLGRTMGDKLRGVPEIRKVSTQELAQHNTITDMWMAIRGVVYNVTPYVDYHPGGPDELMRAAGADGTELFEEVHNWVNVESMMEKCMVGPLVTSLPRLSVLPVNSVKPSIPMPKVVWQQTKGQVQVTVQSNHMGLREDNVLVDLTVRRELLLQVVLGSFTFLVHKELTQHVAPHCNVSVSKGSVVVSLTKEKEVEWSSLGASLKNDEVYSRSKSLEYRYRLWMCVSNVEMTHDTRLLTFKAPAGLKMPVPLGCHIHVKKSISGMELARSYSVVPSSLVGQEKDPDVIAGRKLFLLVKKYKGGAISPWMTGLSHGEQIHLSNYEGSFNVDSLKGITHLVCFSAGTGITPMVNVIKYTLFELDTVHVQLVFCNKSICDIIWKDQWEQLAQKHKRLKVCHVLSQEPSLDWSGKRGRVSREHIEEFVPKPSASIRPRLLICGQFAYNDYVHSISRLHGLSEEHIFIFAQ